MENSDGARELEGGMIDGERIWPSNDFAEEPGKIPTLAWASRFYFIVIVKRVATRQSRTFINNTGGGVFKPLHPQDRHPLGTLCSAHMYFVGYRSSAYRFSVWMDGFAFLLRRIILQQCSYIIAASAC